MKEEQDLEERQMALEQVKLDMNHQKIAMELEETQYDAGQRRAKISGLSGLAKKFE